MRVTAPVKAAAQRLALPLLVLTSVLLVVLGKADVLLFDRVRVQLADVVSPVLQVIAAPAETVSLGMQRIEDMVSVYRQNAELREENERLMRWQEVARRLEAENVQLRGLVKLVPENPVNYIAAKVIADSGGAFVRNVLVNAGRREGAARGQAAVTGEGLVGRIAEVGERTARILLITDLNSHIPVMLERSHDRAVLDGDNSDAPLLVYLAPKVSIAVGDRIVTSGSGGVFPPNLPVGTIASIDGSQIRITPSADLSRLEMVRIVDYGLGGVLPQSAVPPPRSVKGARPVLDEQAR